ncbi:MAG TPA: hypothetical protein VD969_20845 [Symbiobacteriaceae bacterium]|nr:hypothetical protein [Symbiobacteriaceae bacterium]
MERREAESVPRAVFTDPIVQLAALCPFCALAALSPVAALAALSPALRIFNPAINPEAALLSFSLGGPQAAVTARVGARVNTRLVGLIRKVYPQSTIGS